MSAKKILEVPTNPAIMKAGIKHAQYKDFLLMQSAYSHYGTDESANPS